MSIAFSLLLISVAIVPGLVILDGLVAQSLIAVLAAAALGFVGISARSADVNFAAQVTRRLKLATAVPAIWMVLQILPIPFSRMSHSIWINANEALDRNSWGHVSIDVGMTIEALVFYLANVAVIVVTVFAARDRRRAEIALFALTAVTTLTTIALLISKTGLVAGVSASEMNEMLGAISSLGIILSLTTAVRAVERHESRPAESERPAQNTALALAVCGAGLLICLVGVAASATLNLALTVAFGAVVFASIQAIRRVGLESWALGIFIATMAAGAAMVVVWRYDTTRLLSPFLQFASAASPNAISVAQRILSDTSWLGTGAATYAPLLPIYQELGSSVTSAPSTASAFAIELGWPMTLFTIAVTVGLFVTLYRGALVRGRDSFYPAAAAASTIIILGQAFCDAGLMHTCVDVIADAVIGLGLAQSVSQRDGSQP